MLSDLDELVFIVLKLMKDIVNDYLIVLYSIKHKVSVCHKVYSFVSMLF